MNSDHRRRNKGELLSIFYRDVGLPVLRAVVMKSSVFPIRSRAVR
jgi:hypothetical protein